MSLILSGSDGLSDVDGSAATPAIRGTDANTGIFFPAADTIAFSEGGVEAARFDSSGNLGLGLTSTAGGGRLAVLYGSSDGLSGTGYRAASFYSTSAVNADQPGIILGYDSGGAGIIAARTNATGQPLAFWTYNGAAWGERARILSSGEFLVGKPNKSPGTVGISIEASGYQVLSMTGSTNAIDTLNVYSTGASLYRFYVGMGGTIYATSTVISAISDIRYKENVRDLDVGLSEVMALKPRLYDWKEGKGQDIKNARGFIAQEFETVFPDLIDTWKDPAPEGEEPYKSVRADLIPVLVKAIQEQQAIINQLQADVAALKAV